MKSYKFPGVSLSGDGVINEYGKSEDTQLNANIYINVIKNTNGKFGEKLLPTLR